MLEEFFKYLSSFGYLGIFLISLIGNATIIFPLPSAIFIFSLGAFLNPFFLAIIAGIGATLGEVIGYSLGYGGWKVSKKKYGKKLNKAKKLFEKYGGFFVLFLFAATPLPDDIAGIIGGFFKYDIKKFFIAVFLGKFSFYLILSIAGYYGINWIINFLI